MKRIFLPQDNALEASVIPDIAVIGIKGLSQVVDILTGDTPIPEGTKRVDIESRKIKSYSPDFSDII
jgi:predicted ATPase with chaperone activity